MVDNHYLDSLRQLCPKQPHYLTRENRKDSLLVKDWNLLVPAEVINKTWGDLLLDQGVINPTLLAKNPGLQKRIQEQLLLQWKAHNVRKHKGLSE